MSINPNVLLGVLQTPNCTLLDMDECVLSVSWLNVDWLTSGAKKKQKQQWSSSGTEEMQNKRTKNSIKIKNSNK